MQPGSPASCRRVSSTSSGPRRRRSRSMACRASVGSSVSRTVSVCLACPFNMKRVFYTSNGFQVPILAVLAFLAPRWSSAAASASCFRIVSPCPGFRVPLLQMSPSCFRCACISSAPCREREHCAVSHCRVCRPRRAPTSKAGRGCAGHEKQAPRQRGAT